MNYFHFDGLLSRPPPDGLPGFLLGQPPPFPPPFPPPPPLPNFSPLFILLRNQMDK
jgi:hypothetical protein